MQDKVSIAATKEKVSIAAAKGGKAFMSLIHKSKHSPEEQQPTGTLNDMHGDSDVPTANSPKTSMERKEKLAKLLKGRFKGKEKSIDAENRSQLLDGNQDDLSPRVRSADSIKVAYGHKPSTDPTSVAAITREKLIERQEKLQAMNKESDEMLEGAGNFASLAEELAKKTENKKWYKL